MSVQEGQTLVSIRYIAVLGFQLGDEGVQLEAFEGVSIRYIAVLGFQRGYYPLPAGVSGAVSIRYIAVLGFQPQEAS